MPHGIINQGLQIYFTNTLSLKIFLKTWHDIHFLILHPKVFKEGTLSIKLTPQSLFDPSPLQLRLYSTQHLEQKNLWKLIKRAKISKTSKVSKLILLHFDIIKCLQNLYIFQYAIFFPFAMAVNLQTLSKSVKFMQNIYCKLHPQQFCMSWKYCWVLDAYEYLDRTNVFEFLSV